MKTSKNNTINMYQPSEPITDYEILRNLLIQRDQGTLPFNQLERPVHLYRGLSKAQDQVIPQGQTAGGATLDANVSYPTDIAGMQRQQGSEGEGMPGHETFGGDPFIEYTFNESWASGFSSLTPGALRGRLIKISILLKYVAIPNPNRAGGREQGVFCASAAPMEILDLRP